MIATLIDKSHQGVREIRASIVWNSDRKSYLYTTYEAMFLYSILSAMQHGGAGGKVEVLKSLWLCDGKKEEEPKAIAETNTLLTCFHDDLSISMYQSKYSTYKGGKPTPAKKHARRNTCLWFLRLSRQFISPLARYPPPPLRPRLASWIWARQLYSFPDNNIYFVFIWTHNFCLLRLKTAVSERGRRTLKVLGRQTHISC